MTNDKAERQAIEKVMIEYGFYVHAETIANTVMDRLTDLQPEPSEDNRAKIQELLWVFSCDASANPKETTEEIIRLAKNAELQPVKKTDEELVNEIIEIMESHESKWIDETRGVTSIILDFGQYKPVAREIASILPSQSDEPLEALKELVRLKEWKNRFGKDSYYLCTQPSVWKKANDAIRNAESK